MILPSRAVPILFGLWALACTPSERPPHQPAVTVTDDVGRAVSVASPPTRIISLAPSITETLFALGLDSAVVGVTDYCNYPEEALHLPRVGGMLNPAIERIISLRPDLVVMSGSGNLASDYGRLTNLGLTVFVSYPHDLDGVLKSIHDIGLLTSRERRADALVQSMRQHMDSLRAISSQGPHHTVLVLVSLRPVISAGPGTFINEMIRLCNATNIASGATTAYPILSREEILKRDPDRIIVTSDAVADISEVYDAFPEWRGLKAVADSAIVLVSADTMTRPGPRIIEGLEELYRAIHLQPSPR